MQHLTVYLYRDNVFLRSPSIAETKVLWCIIESDRLERTGNGVLRVVVQAKESDGVHSQRHVNVGSEVLWLF